MSGTIALRSPRYISNTAATGANSSKLVISIDGTVQYTLVKGTTAGATMLWEIAELCRDFINIQFDGTYNAETLSVTATITSHASTDGTGTNLNLYSVTDIAYDGYGTFMEGANSQPPFGSRPTWLVSKNPDGTLNNEYYIYVPTNTSGYVPYMDVNRALGYQSFGTSQTEITGSPAAKTMNIIRVDCSKYGIGHKVTFVNKFGALQDLWFFLKAVNTTNKKQEQYQRNIISSTGTYSVNQHTKQDYNTVANTSITLSSGYYPDWCTKWFEQLLLSEQVWITIPKEYKSTGTEVVPVNVKKNNIIKKTSLNDKLINYVFDFDMSFDYINNIR